MKRYKKLILLFFGCVACFSMRSFAQSSFVSLRQADSLLLHYLDNILTDSLVKDSVAIYHLSIRIDIDSLGHSVDGVLYSDSVLGEQLFPDLQQKLAKGFDFSVFALRNPSIRHIFVPFHLVLHGYNNYEGDYRIPAENFYSARYLQKKQRLLNGLKGNYYVLCGYHIILDRMIYV